MAKLTIMRTATNKVYLYYQGKKSRGMKELELHEYQKIKRLYHREISWNLRARRQEIELPQDQRAREATELVFGPTIETSPSEP